MRRLLDNMQSSALTWMQNSSGDWLIMESTVGRLWALEDADKRQRSAVRKAAMMQLILRMMGVGLKSEMEAVVRRWSLMREQAYWSRRRVRRMFLARYEYWRRRRTDTMIMDDEVVLGQRILIDTRIRNELVDGLSRITAQRQLQSWMNADGVIFIDTARKYDEEALVHKCRACGCEGEAHGGIICSEDLCIICCNRLGCECRVQPAECMGCENTVLGGGLCCKCRDGGNIEDLGPILFEDRSSDEAAEGEDGEEWTQTGGAETMGLARSKDDDRAVAHLKEHRLKEELQSGKGGNCCFRSLAAEAGWGAERHKEMREAAAEKMREEGMATDAECDLMRQLGTWGNTKAIKAVSMIIGIFFFMYVYHKVKRSLTFDIF